jgi:hypothetical protein
MEVAANPKTNVNTTVNPAMNSRVGMAAALLPSAGAYALETKAM